MFGCSFLKNKITGSEKERSAIEFLAALLVSYPEFYSATYVPEKEALGVNIILQGDMSEGDMGDFSGFLKESIETYHDLSDGLVPIISDLQSTTTYGSDRSQTITVFWTRDFETLSRGELTMTADLFVERFKDKLVLDEKMPEYMDDNFADYESHLLDRMLGEMSHLHLKKSLIGLREDNRVVVYNN